MTTKNRRNFLKTISAGFAGSVVLPRIFSENHAYSMGDKQIQEMKGEAYWEAIQKKFLFAPGLRYFNNASLGSSPIDVRKLTTKYRDTLDGFPSKYMWGAWDNEVEEVRKKVAGFFSVSSEEIALIHNTTEGMNLIAKSFDLQPGDEVILADHEHPSGTIPWQVWQESKGIKLIRPTLPILPKNAEEIVAVYKKAITSKTKLISMCHMVNTNGMILPVKEVSEMAHEKNILVAVDGAQAAGMIKIDLNELGCDFYTASAHKWLFSPKGIGVLYARQQSQHYLKPLIVARGHTDKTIRRLENYNTRNLPELLGLGSAIDFLNSIGIQKINDRSFELKAYFRSKIASNPKLKLKTPGDDRLSSAIQVVEVIGKNVFELKKLLFEKYGIDCRPMDHFKLNAMRFSFAVYITKKDIDYLFNALKEVV